MTKYMNVYQFSILRMSSFDGFRMYLRIQTNPANRRFSVLFLHLISKALKNLPYRLRTILIFLN
jgi:hypothetical protein